MIFDDWFYVFCAAVADFYCVFVKEFVCFCCRGKFLFNNIKKQWSTFVSTFLMYGEWNHIISFFLFFLLSSSPQTRDAHWVDMHTKANLMVQVSLVVPGCLMGIMH